MPFPQINRLRNPKFSLGYPIVQHWSAKGSKSFGMACTHTERAVIQETKLKEDALSSFATFSIVARCPKTFSLGVCTSSAASAVGSRVPHVEVNVGAIATQANTRTLYGINGLKLLKKGVSPEAALKNMLQEDPDRETRQVIIIDGQGRTAAFTGKRTINWKGHLIGRDYVVAGNMLVGNKVIEAMAQAFENSRGVLAERLIKALAAGQESGGDKRGKTSAALSVASRNQKEILSLIDLRVDDHPAPVDQLRRMFEDFRRKRFDNNELSSPLSKKSIDGSARTYARRSNL